MHERILDVENIRRGLHMLEDGTRAPYGSARVMRNMMITDRGGLANCPGRERVGVITSDGINGGLYAFKKADVAGTQYLLHAHGSYLDFYDEVNEEWVHLAKGFTPSQQFDFEVQNVNSDWTDYVYFCNGKEPYSRWSGKVIRAAADYAGGAGTVTVDSAFLGDVFFSLPYDFNGSLIGQADLTGGGTILTLPANTVVDDQWNGYYVHVLTGVHAGKVSKISDMTAAGVITIDTIGADTTGLTFEVRRLAIPLNVPLIAGPNGESLTFTAVTSTTTFTVGATCPALTDGWTLSQAIEQYPAAPRGNRITSLYSRMYLGKVASGLGNSGSMVATMASGSVFVSKVLSGDDFTVTYPRIAGSGDVVGTDTGGPVEDVIAHLDAVYIGKQNSISRLQYTQDVNDTATKEFLKGGVGLVGRFIRGKDDVYLVTPQKEITSLGRVPGSDSTEYVVNVGLPIKRLLDLIGINDANGLQWKNRLLISYRSTPSSKYNDSTLVYNVQEKAFEGSWDFGFIQAVEYNNELYAVEHGTPNVYKLFTGNDVVKGDERYQIPCEWRSHWFSLSKSKFNDQEISCLGIEGYIKEKSPFTFELYKGYSDSPILQVKFNGTIEEFLDGSIKTVYLGSDAIGLHPMGAISGTVDDDGRRHFMFLVYFPQTQSHVFSMGIKVNTVNPSVEIIRAGLNVSEAPEFNLSKVM